MGTPAAVLAVDGGNSKTDLALLDSSGRLLASLRWGTTSHQVLGLDGAVASLREAVAELAAAAGVTPTAPLARVAALCLAGLDLPVDDRRVGAALAAEPLADEVLLRNDTFAILRAGSDHGWGVALVCGAGMNCVAAAPDGRRVRFPALGAISGDGPSGGQWLGLQALGAAVRSTDGRGAATDLTSAVPRHFGLDEPVAVTEAIYTGRLSERRLVELAPVVFEVAGTGDHVARGLLDQLADELALLARAALTRLELLEAEVPVVLGGGLFRSGDPRFLGRVRDGILGAAPAADIHLLRTPPVVGAALLGFDALGATASVTQEIRSLSLDASPARPIQAPDA